VIKQSIQTIDNFRRQRAYRWSGRAFFFLMKTTNPMAGMRTAPASIVLDNFSIEEGKKNLAIPVLCSIV